MPRSVVLAVAVSWIAASPLRAQSVQDETGLTALKDRVGASAPTGAGVHLGQGRGQRGRLGAGHDPS
jgi:hypothetical protein